MLRMLFISTACHDKYGSDPTNFAGYGISPGSLMNDNMNGRNNVGLHFNQPMDGRDNINSTSNYNNYDGLAGFYDHLQETCDEKDGTGTFLTGDSINKTTTVDSSNEPAPARKFPNNSTEEARNQQQVTMDRSPDVIPHGIGKHIIN